MKFIVLNNLDWNYLQLMFLRHQFSMAKLLFQSGELPWSITRGRTALVSKAGLAHSFVSFPSKPAFIPSTILKLQKQSKIGCFRPWNQKVWFQPWMFSMTFSIWPSQWDETLDENDETQLDIHRMWRIDFTVNKLSAVPALVALGRLRFACFATNEITSLEVGFVGSCWWEQGWVGIE